MNVVEAGEMARDDTKVAAGVAGPQIERQRATPVARLVHTNAAHLEAAALDQADDTQQSAFVQREIDFEPVAGHLRFSIICTLELLGGTKGQTFSRGSMRTWQRIGPWVYSRRWIAAGTSER